MPPRNQASIQMGRLRLNCDLGENESLEQTKALLRYVDAANISCGVHAGSPEKTRQTIALAKEFGVLVGAPGRGCGRDGQAKLKGR